jgi:hypothetical protein
MKNNLTDNLDIFMTTISSWGKYWVDENGHKVVGIAYDRLMVNLGWRKWQVQLALDTIESLGDISVKKCSCGAPIITILRDIDNG